MKPLQPITMVAYNRPKYTEQVIRALEKCVGIEDCVLLARIEPGCPETGRVIASYKYKKEVRFNDFRLGCNCNTKMAIMDGFHASTSNYNIHIEDDTVPDVDALQFLFFVRDYMPNINIASCYRGPGNSISTDIDGTQIENWFYPWVWGCRYYQWKKHIDLIVNESGVSWDSQFNKNMKDMNELIQLVPCCARSLNIGAKGGVHVPSENWHALNQFNPDWAGSFNHKVIMSDRWCFPDAAVKKVNLNSIGENIKQQKVSVKSWRNRRH